MKIDDLRTGWRGYRKEDVCRLISQVEQDASKRLAEKDSQIDQLKEESRVRIAQLEAELHMARRQQEAELNGKLGEDVNRLVAEYSQQLRRDLGELVDRLDIQTRTLSKDVRKLCGSADGTETAQGQPAEG